MRSPVLVVLAALFAIEAVTGLILFAARLISGRAPGESIHIAAGAAVVGVYAVYQARHWARVRSLRWRLDHGLGLLAAVFMVLTLASGAVLALSWWDTQAEPDTAAKVAYSPLWSALHNVASLLILTFLGAHLCAVLFRDR